MQKLGVMPGKDAAQYADAVGQFLMDRYGSKYAILKTLVTDPVRIVVDVSTVLSAGGSLAVRALAPPRYSRFLFTVPRALGLP